MRRALLVVDMQRVYMEKKVYRREDMLAAVGQALAEFRETGDPIVFVRHCGALSPRGTPGWEVHPALDRRTGDLSVEKEHGDAFDGTGLASLLREADVGEVLVCGLVSHGCVRATCLGGLSAGFRVTLLKDGHSTWTRDAEARIRGTEEELADRGVRTAPGPAFPRTTLSCSAGPSRQSVPSPSGSRTTRGSAPGTSGA